MELGLEYSSICTMVSFNSPLMVWTVDQHPRIRDWSKELTSLRSLWWTRQIRLPCSIQESSRKLTWPTRACYPVLEFIKLKTRDFTHCWSKSRSISQTKQLRKTCTDLFLVHTLTTKTSSTRSAKKQEGLRTSSHLWHRARFQSKALNRRNHLRNSMLPTDTCYKDLSRISWVQP